MGILPVVVRQNEGFPWWGGHYYSANPNYTPSLKLTVRPLKINELEDEISSGPAYFQRLVASFRKCNDPTADGRNPDQPPGISKKACK